MILLVCDPFRFGSSDLRINLDLRIPTFDLFKKYLYILIWHDMPMNHGYLKWRYLKSRIYLGNENFTPFLQHSLAHCRMGSLSPSRRARWGQIVLCTSPLMFWCQSDVKKGVEDPPRGGQNVPPWPRFVSPLLDDFHFDLLSIYYTTVQITSIGVFATTSLQASIDISKLGSY